MKKSILFMLLLLFITTIAYSQVTVTGKITAKGGDPLPGATILETGTTNGTVTDKDGNYSIKIRTSTDASLTISFIGYITKTIPLNGMSQLSVELVEATENLDEVIVIGYGEIRKRDLTGSVTKVSETENIARQYNTVDALLQGRAAGVQVSSNPGAPGSAISVRIRGTNSLRGNNEPLYVVDGVIISSAAEDVRNASTDSNELQAQQNGLTGLNPRDIESIEILKDASATAIYGSRGANGVVLITTRKGVSDTGKAKINVFSTIDFSWVSKKIDLLDPMGYASYQNEIDKLNGSNPRYQVTNGEIYSVSYQTDPGGQTVPVVGSAPLKQIDWQDEMYGLAISSNQGLSFSGQKDKTNFYFSAGYNDTRGIVETTRIRQGDLRLNLSTDLAPKLKFDNRISVMYLNGTFANAGSKSGGNRSFTKEILSYRPVVGFAGAESDELDLEESNPYAWITDYDDLSEETRVNLSTSLEYQILKGLKYKLQGGIDFRTKDRSRWYGTELFKGGQANGLANYSLLKRYSYTIDNILSFDKKINKTNTLNAIAALTYDGNNLKNSIYEIGDFPVKTLRSSVPQLGQIVQQPYALVYSDEQILSGLGRINYAIRDKYILTASFRADQSSKFASGKKWGYFPSAAFAWRLSEEKFIKDLKWFYNMKLRLGWGQTGNQAINPYQTLSTYSTSYYVNDGNSTIIGNVPSRIANENLTWETTEQYNGGLDVSIFEGRLSATIDAYYKRTRDLLQDIQLPTSTGFQSMTINRGEIENKGVEFSLDGLIINKKDITFGAAGHISFNRNKVLNLGLPSATVWIDGKATEAIYYLGNNVSTGTYFKCPANIFMEGQPIGMFWGYKTDGIYKDQAAADSGPKNFGSPNKAGDLVMVDVSGDGNVGIEDMTFIGNPNPDFTYGIDFTITYRKFTLKALFDGVYGNDIANGYNMELAFAESTSKNVLAAAYKNAWRPETPTGSYTRIGYTENGKGFPDVIVEDGSYLRLNNVTLGYDIAFKNSFVKNLNIYVTGRNLFYLTKYSGYEPQVTSFLFDGTIMGVDWVGTPNVVSVLTGLNITF